VISVSETDRWCSRLFYVERVVRRCHGAASCSQVFRPPFRGIAFRLTLGRCPIGDSMPAGRPVLPVSGKRRPGVRRASSCFTTVFSPRSSPFPTPALAPGQSETSCFSCASFPMMARGTSLFLVHSPLGDGPPCRAVLQNRSETSTERPLPPFSQGSIPFLGPSCLFLSFFLSSRSPNQWVCSCVPTTWKEASTAETT